MSKMINTKHFVIDKKNDVICRVYQWQMEYGVRFGYTLEVANTDPFVNTTLEIEGRTSAAQAERDAREMYSTFHAGDELARGVVKV